MTDQRRFEVVLRVTSTREFSFPPEAMFTDETPRDTAARLMRIFDEEDVGEEIDVESEWEIREVDYDPDRHDDHFWQAAQTAVVELDPEDRDLYLEAPPTILFRPPDSDPESDSDAE